MAPLPHSINYLVSVVQRGEHSPLRGLEHWSPFRIDALGLVTLLGAEEVDKSIGTLQRRRFTEWLPLLAAFVIAGDRFTDERPGYSLYNVTDGIHTTELKGWFTRWLSAQKIRSSTTVFHWKIEPSPRQYHPSESAAPILAFLTLGPLLVCTCLIGDWFGVGNCVAIILSILVRKLLLWQWRTGLNSAVVPETPKALPLHESATTKRHQSIDTFTKQLHREISQPSREDVVTLLVTRADGKLVTIYAPRSVLSTFVRDVPLPSSRLYHAVRWIGWAAFGAHIVVLGMSSLFTQIYTVILLVLSTWALCHGFEFDIGRQRLQQETIDGTISNIKITSFTSRLIIEQENPANESRSGQNLDKRLYAYVRIQPTEKQEAMLKHWSMLPFEGVPWYDGYEQAKLEHRQHLQRASSTVRDEGSTPPQTPSIVSREVSSPASSATS